MGTLKFSELSYELKAMVISYVRLPSDMKRLCLVNKDMRDIAVRQLYRRVELNVGCEDDMKLSAFLGRDNPGLEHIRTLALNPDSADDYVTPPRQRSPTPPSPHPQPANFNEIVTLPHGQGFVNQPPPPLPPPPDGPHDPIVIMSPRVRTEKRKARYDPAHFTTKLLLELLPRDTLEKFRWTSYDEFAVDNFLLLLKRQKKLRSIEVGPTDRSLREALEKHPDVLKGLDELHVLDLYPDSVDTLKACRMVMQAAPKLDELWIESACEPSSNADDQNFEDESSRPGLITTTLFADKTPFQTCTSPMSLRYLALNKLGLRWSAQTYLRTIDFPNLEELEVRGCSGSDALFAELSKPAKRPTKLELLSFSLGADSTGYALSALEGFLDGITTLKKLYITIQGTTLPKIDVLCKQAENLTALVVHSAFVTGPFEPQRIVYSHTDVERLARECPNIQQLALACPLTHVLHTSCSEEYYRFMEAIKLFPELITLNFTTYPSISPAYNPGNLTYQLDIEIFEHNVLTLAQWNFKANAHHAGKQAPPRTPKLRVQAFGPNIKNYHQNNICGKMVPLVYTLGTRVGALGQSSRVAVRVQPEAVKYVEPDSEILDYVFPDHPSPPGAPVPLGAPPPLQ